MTTHNFNSPVQVQAKRLRFDRYVLDLDRGCLLLDGNEIALRPKTFAVLHYLVENSGRLVSKDELFAAVWPNLAVTDDALVQSIGELRRALGDDGARLIRTIPRRGYRFESDVSVVAPVGQPSADAAPVSRVLRCARSPSPHVGARARIVATALTGSRIGLVAAFLAVLLAAGVLWGGVGNRVEISERFRDTQIDPQPRTPRSARNPRSPFFPSLNQSDDSARDYFADGLTQDIINALGRFSELTVMSWNAVFPYKGKARKPRRRSPAVLRCAIRSRAASARLATACG